MYDKRERADRGQDETEQISDGWQGRLMRENTGDKYRKLKIDREDMLALTRRMTVKRNSITRIAGAYLDPDGFVDGTFNTRFLKLSDPDRAKNLEIAKTVPFAETNRNLIRYVVPEEAMGPGSMWQLLMGARSAALENDSLLDVFYEIAGETYRSEKEYGIFLFHDRYDIPAKAADHERLGESERVFEYLICTVCPVSSDYEPGEPECGFLFPSYSKGGALLNCIDIYQADPGHPHREFPAMLLDS